MGLGVRKIEETSHTFHRIVAGARQVAEMNHISQATASNVKGVLNATEEQLGSIEEIAALGEQLNLLTQDLGDRMSKALE
ncbi:hypothetical protein OMP38_10630 [Cohnella ginsengisoli]|uniref:Methyl-accepting chemotaxis protein n=1 Tax=Cohnella ginsengisoli TaxID=425004 RepID=A0A9X4KFY8_9BACL|nr:hypothetical protein [Cohnella ginsengisoli]MDG0791276.1 hypothetical protein [Cohnella ginsengisoli]